jgi:hypothetical protein
MKESAMKTEAQIRIEREANRKRVAKHRKRKKIMREATRGMLPVEVIVSLTGFLGEQRFRVASRHLKPL